MAHQSPIQHYRSVTAGVAPPSLLGGELFINEADSKLFYRASDGSVQFNQLSTVKDAVSSGITRTGHFSHRTTGTPAIGIGAGIEFEVQTATTPTFKVGAAIDCVSTVVSAGTESFDLVFKTMAAGAAAAERVRIGGAGRLGVGTSNFTTLDQVGNLRPWTFEWSDNSVTLNGSLANLVIANSDPTTNNAAQISFASYSQAGPAGNRYAGATISAIFGARTAGQYTPTTLVISTGGASLAPVEALRIDSAQKIIVAKDIQIGDDTSVSKIDIGSFGAYLGRHSSDGAVLLHNSQANILIETQSIISFRTGLTPTEAMFIDGTQHVFLDVPPTAGDNSSRVATTSFVAASGITFSPTGGANSKTLLLNTTYNFVRVWNNPGNNSISSAPNPNGKMLGWTISTALNVTGNFLLFVSFDANTSDGSGWQAEMHYGTGTPPSLGAAVVGSGLSGRTFIGPGPSNSNQFIRCTIASYSVLTTGTTYWFDLVGYCNSGITLNIFNVEFTLIEIF